MRITELDFNLIDFVKPTEGRSDGLHLSQVLRDIDNKIINPGKRRDFNDMSQAEQSQGTIYQQAGFVFEDLMTGLWRSRLLPMFGADQFVQQQEIERDGIFMTPDAVYVPDWTLIETKLTWKSRRRWEESPESNFWYWLEQIKSYCYALECDTADLFVFWVNGNYKPMVPSIGAYQLKFTPEELSNTWRMVTRHAEIMRRENVTQ